MKLTIPYDPYPTPGTSITSTHRLTLSNNTFQMQRTKSFPFRWDDEESCDDTQRFLVLSDGKMICKHKRSRIRHQMVLSKKPLVLRHEDSSAWIAAFMMELAVSNGGKTLQNSIIE